MVRVEQQHLAGLGLTAAAAGLLLVLREPRNVPDALLLSLGLLLVAVAVAAWERLRLLALVGFFVALYPAGHSWMAGLQAIAPDVGARSFLLLVPLIGLPMTLLSVRRSHPTHLSVACVCGAAAGLWWAVVDLGARPTAILADALYGFGFLLSAFSLSTRWREDGSLPQQQAS